MSDEEKQLTVAELLERAQANRGGNKRSAGRRHRRSLEDGGISVAELTGSLSRVKDKPAESRHSAVPIDTPESERRPRQPSTPAATAPSVAGLNPTPVKGATAAPWGKPDQAGKAAPSPRPAGSAGPRTPAATNPVKPAPASQPRAQKPAGTQDGPAAPQGAPRGGTPAGWGSASTPRPQHPTTGAQPAKPQGSAAQPATAPGKAAWPIPVSARRAASASAPKKPQAAAAQGAGARAAAAEPSAEETAVMSPVGSAAKKQTPAPRSAATAQARDAEETGRIPRVSEKNSGPSEKKPQKPGEGAKKKRPPEPHTGAGSAVLLAVMGVVLGALVFIGFDQLWSSGLSRILVGMLALAVIGVMVGVVHALRTARDGVSMSLAAVVGFLMTFGPHIPDMF
ncbi:hypothetical protein H7347_09050 [Corynebacterium sp. zg-331]|uniref:hypothetical protein n=1 Tax=unclassified Corynebacterium TaxID=2624378 RepID=UPI00164313FD|nr:MULTISPECIES: hypothetical protein [unclassified Corynebacterium]MBC3186708.1 hypothetical protein [Corynebacterium sp. zg-331]